jgi:hypothetical protein
VQVVQGPESFGGGMEYPTITVISPTSDPKELDITIAHEIGHNWFYGILASNEREHPWMDEGINSYYDAKYSLTKYGKQAQLERICLRAKPQQELISPLNCLQKSSVQQTMILLLIIKRTEWMRYLESQLGTEEFNKAMQEYFRRWQFKHPQPEDFKKTMEESSGKDLDPVFSYLNKTGILPNQQRSGSKIAFLFDIKSLSKYATEPSKDLYIFGPAIGFNSYDKFMGGAFVTNMKLPPSKLEFFLAPMYATGSKSLRGLGFLNYSFYPNKLFRKIELGVNASTFTADEFIDSDGG